ncbi:MAG: flagellar hook capping protein [Planctomycetaceae bacterium]|nr:flagellar hook capping protein [Planctomycetaceae bacterium]
MAVIGSATNATTKGTIDIVDQRSVGFGSLTAEDFLKMLVVQLQNQDPTEPTSNEALLAQLSDMRTLQSSIDMEDLLTSNAQTTLAANAASLIGKAIVTTILDPNTGDNVRFEGIVDRAILRDGKLYIGVGDKEFAFEDIEEVKDKITVPETLDEETATDETQTTTT